VVFFLIMFMSGRGKSAILLNSSHNLKILYSEVTRRINGITHTVVLKGQTNIEHVSRTARVSNTHRLGTSYHRHRQRRTPPAIEPAQVSLDSQCQRDAQ
jgi:hypothetical protein